LLVGLCGIGVRSCVGSNPFWSRASRSHLSGKARNWVGLDLRERDVSWW
jgi:hypothetical protein